MIYYSTWHPMSEQRKGFLASLLPPPTISAWEWCEKHIILSAKQSTAFPGPYRTSLTPYVRGIFDTLQDSSIHTVSVMKGAQTGLTCVAHCWHVYRSCENPGPAMIIMPTERLGRSVSETRIQPLFRDSDRASQELPTDPDNFKILEYRLLKCQINIEGSNSASALASRAVRDLTMDETDKYPVDMVREANPPALAEQRTKTFWNRKILKISTPTTDDGYINRSFLQGDRRRYHVPCPHCSAMHYLKWSQFKFDSTLHPDEAGESSYYECESCQGKIDESHRTAMMEAGEWIATATPDGRGIASVHLPSYYAPWVKWSDLISKFMRVKDYPGELRDFINSELGEPWQVDTIDVADDTLSDRRADYKVNDIPSTVGLFGDKQTARFLTVDVQKAHLWVCIREWARGGDSALILFDRAFEWKTVVELADGFDCQHVMVDSGYGERTQEVYEACHEHQFIPCHGGSGRMSMTWMQSNINIFEGKRRQDEGESIALVTHDTSALKFQLFDRINGASAFEWWIPENIDADYCDQVTAEKYVEHKDKWELIRRDNHALDCEVMQILAATIAGYNTRIFTD